MFKINSNNARDTILGTQKMLINAYKYLNSFLFLIPRNCLIVLSPAASKMYSHCCIHTQYHVSGGLHVHLQYYLVFWLCWCWCSCFHMPSVGGVIVPIFVSLCNLLVYSPGKKSLSSSSHICTENMCGCFLHPLVLLEQKAHNVLRESWLLCLTQAEDMALLGQHLTMSDHILAALPSVALSIPPAIANLCASEALTASQADSCSNRLVLVMPGL